MLRELRKRRLAQILGGYLAAGFLALEGTDQLIGNGLLSDVAYRIPVITSRSIPHQWCTRLFDSRTRD